MSLFFRRLHLVADHRPGVIERRKGSCASLAACEYNFSRRFGVLQARCPDRCLRFVRAEPRPVEMSGGGGIVVGGAL